PTSVKSIVGCPHGCGLEWIRTTYFITNLLCRAGTPYCARAPRTSEAPAGPRHSAWMYSSSHPVTFTPPGSVSATEDQTRTGRTHEHHSGDRWSGNDRP